MKEALQYLKWGLDEQNQRLENAIADLNMHKNALERESKKIESILAKKKEFEEAIRKLENV